MKALLLLCVLMALAGCARTVYVPAESKHIEYRDRLSADSVYIRDSVSVISRSDTVFVERHKYLYRDKIVRDSVIVLDSVSYPVHIEVVKENRYVPRFYRWSLVFSLLTLGFGAWRILRKFKLF